MAETAHVTYFSRTQTRCPICDTAFAREEMRTGRGRLIAGSLTDELRRNYEPSRKFGKVNPLLYPVTVCPSCYYGAYERDFLIIPEDAKANGSVRTLMGRVRPIPGIASRNRTEQMAAQRIAVNTPIQGSAADIVKLAMLNVVACLNREQLASKLILQVHDELVFEVPEIEVDRMRKLVKREMEQVVKLDVPLRVSIETGKSWGDLH